jgi:hypothetical protein
MYGTTYYGGLFSNGIIFCVRGYTNPISRLESRYSFQDSVDGGFPSSRLTFRARIVFGTTTDSYSGAGNGTVYEIFPPPRLGAPVVSGGNLSANCWDAQVGVTYQPQYSWTLAPGSWSDWGQPVLASSNKFVLKGSVSGFEGFLRVQAEPPWPLTISYKY